MNINALFALLSALSDNDISSKGNADTLVKKIDNTFATFDRVARKMVGDLDALMVSIITEELGKRSLSKLGLTPLPTKPINPEDVKEIKPEESDSESDDDEEESEDKPAESYEKLLEQYKRDKYVALLDRHGDLFTALMEEVFEESDYDDQYLEADDNVFEVMTVLRSRAKVIQGLVNKTTKTAESE